MRNAPKKLSPEPVVSTTCVSYVESARTHDGVHTTQPFAPRVTTTACTPRANSAAAPAGISAQSVSISSSSSETLTTSASGSRLRIARTPVARSGHSGARQFGSYAVITPCARAYSTICGTAVRPGSAVSSSEPKQSTFAPSSCVLSTSSKRSCVSAPGSR